MVIILSMRIHLTATATPTGFPIAPTELLTMSALANNGGLRASHVCFSYGKRQIIDNICLELKPGTLTALVGPEWSW